LWHPNFCEVAIFIHRNAFGIRIVSARQPIRLPAYLTSYLYEMWAWYMVMLAVEIKTVKQHVQCDGVNSFYTLFS